MSFRAKVYIVLATILIFTILLFCAQVVSIVFAVRRRQSRLKLGMRLASLFMLLYFVFMFAHVIVKSYTWSFSSMGLFGRIATMLPSVEIMDGALSLNTLFIFYPLLMIALLVISAFVGNSSKRK